MKRLLIITAVTLLTGTAAHAQWAVIDGTSIMDRGIKHAETLRQWAQQYKQMTSQLDQLKTQAAALTGNRGLGQIMNDPSLREYLPSDWKDVYDSVRKGGYSGLAGAGADVYAANRYFDACASIHNSDQRIACEAAAVKPSQDKALAADAYDAAKKRLGQIDRLMSQIDQTQDPKAIAELQGRIAAEQAMIANEQTKLQLYAMMAASEDRIQEQRQREIDAKQNARRGYLTLKPVQF